MAKKKLFKKGQKIDWKFVALLLGILLVGLSVFVLNQKATYKSSASERDDCISACKAMDHSSWGGRQNCIRSCKGQAPNVIDWDKFWRNLEKAKDPANEEFPLPDPDLPQPE